MPIRRPYRVNLRCEAGPDETSRGDRALLGVGDQLRGAGKVGDVGKCDGPLEGRGPEMDRLGPGGVVPEGGKPRRHDGDERWAGPFLSSLER